jgi:Na+/phosphate symporter
MTFGNSELARFLRSTRDYKVSTCLTKARQVVSLHPSLPIAQKEQIIQKILILQRTLLEMSVDSDNHQEIRKSNLIIEWCDKIKRIVDELEPCQINRAQGWINNDEDLFERMLDMLDKVPNLSEH